MPTKKQNSTEGVDAVVGKLQLPTALILGTMRKEDAGVVDGMDPLEELASTLLHQKKIVPIRSIVGDETALLQHDDTRQVCRALVVGEGRMGSRTLRLMAGRMPQWHDRTLRFFTAVLEAFPELTQKQLNADTLSHSLLASPSIWHGMAIAWHEGLFEHQPPKTEEEMIEFFTALGPYLQLPPGEAVPAPRGGDGYRLGKKFVEWIDTGIPTAVSV